MADVQIEVTVENADTVICLEASTLHSLRHVQRVWEGFIVTDSKNAFIFDKEENAGIQISLFVRFREIALRVEALINELNESEGLYVQDLLWFISEQVHENDLLILRKL